MFRVYRPTSGYPFYARHSVLIFGPGLSANARYDSRVVTDPANLRIAYYPEPSLKMKARPIETINGHVREVAGRMIELMFEAEGIGLAAPQVGLPWRMFVAHVPEDDSRSAVDEPPSASHQPQVFINPELFDLCGEMVPLEEGCLSLPDIRGEIVRPHHASIRAVDESGGPITLHAQALLARCWQHEIDHLDGVLIIDRMTQLSRLKVRSAVRALERQSLMY